MEQHIKKIHDASMQVLEKTGMVFLHPRAVEVLKKNGIKVEGNRAYFTEDQVMSWVKKAPESFTVYARNPKYNMTIGGDHINRAPGYGASMIVDADGSQRQSMYSDFIEFAKLYHQSENYKVNGGVLVQPNDIPAEKSLAMMLYATLNYSDKCLSTGTGYAEEVGELMDMLSIVFGGKEDFAKKPRIITIVNVNSPLQLDKSMTETMLTYIDYNQPVVITPGIMGGTTAPVSQAGMMVLNNAEALAVIALAQMVREGTPVVYGGVATPADMRTGAISIGAPERAKLCEWLTQLSKAYGLPCRTGGTQTDAKTVSVQSGYESMMNYFVSHQNKVNYIIHSSGILDAYSCMSFEQFVVDEEIINMVKQYFEPVDFGEDKLATDTIDDVGPGGQFLTTMHTMKNCRTELFSPDISIRGTVNGDPNKALMKKISKKKEAMLAAYKKPELPENVKLKLDDYMLSRGYDPKWLAC